MYGKHEINMLNSRYSFACEIVVADICGVFCFIAVRVGQ